jgi:hypothetical protein
VPDAADELPNLAKFGVGDDASSFVQAELVNALS